MTREEALGLLTYISDSSDNRLAQALNMAIKALEHESVFDKYKAEGEGTVMQVNEETLRDEVLLFLEYYTRTELLNIVIEAIEMHDSIKGKEGIYE